MATLLRGASRVVATASSVGGLDALMRVLSELPADFPAAVLVGQHRSAVKGSLVAKILQRSTPLVVTPMASGQSIEPGCVYVAPPDRHATVTPAGTLELSDGRLIRHLRSSANPLFASLAEVYGPQAIGVVLTGSAREGSDGVQAIRKAGGIVVAQDEAASQFFSMPRSAIETGAVTYIVPLGEISHLLRYLAAIAPGAVQPAGTGSVTAGA